MIDEPSLESPVLVTDEGKPRWTGNLEISVANRESVILTVRYDSDDCYWSFYQHIPLGQILTSLGLTAEDCARAIEAWGAHSETWKARSTKVAGDG